ncbi:Olfactory Receptor 2W3 [Manis pentadactyla]|nr:Olfactory Receptor 2W3 [Manis pentadactyla]
MMAFTFAFLIVLLPFTLILVSYGYIAAAVLWIKSDAGCQKAFNTCSFLLTRVFLFYGSIIYMYMQPGTSASQDQAKFLTLFYNMVIPMLNPLIYTVSYKEVKGALKKVLGDNNEQDSAKRRKKTKKKKNNKKNERNKEEEGGGGGEEKEKEKEKEKEEEEEKR